MDFSKTHVVAVISNPLRYQSRYDLFHKFRQDIERKGATLWTVECQTGQRYTKVTNWHTNRDFQIWTTGLRGLFWNKESLQEYVVTQLTAHQKDWRKIIFTDADVKYSDEWLEKTSHQLELHPVVQPWSHAVDYAPDGSAVSDKMQLSFAYAYVNEIEIKSNSSYVFGGHPGYSLAMRRETYNDLGGIVTIGGLGSGDRHQMCALVGKVHESYHHDISPGYKRWLDLYQQRCEKYVKRNIGYTPEIVRHMFHGSKKNRQYGSRWKILTKWQYDPYTDLKKDSNGLWTFIVEDERQIGLRDATYRYFRSRQEDANSL